MRCAVAHPFPAAAAAESPNAYAQRAVTPGLATGLSEIPAHGRHVLVDAASARLFMIENGQVVDSMRVIVGKADSATPTLRSTIYHATLNPYWNVPVDLARKIIAPRVLSDGPSYLKARGYEVLTKFGPDAQEIDPDSVDWQAVAAGRTKVYVRQLPGPGNSMGRMKFGFVNNNGIFLHDTPKKELFEEASRQLSNGCVRLEDADRLARWMLGRDPAAEQAAPSSTSRFPPRCTS